MKRLLIVCLLALTGCSATMETRYGKNADPNAPVNEANGGVVSYLNEGAQSVKEARRRDAYKKMHETCGGDYKIVQEGESLGEGSAVPIGGILYYGQDKLWKIKFECVKA